MRVYRSFLGGLVLFLGMATSSLLASSSTDILEDEETPTLSLIAPPSKPHPLIVQIAEQTGNAKLFLAKQAHAFDALPLQTLEEFIASQYFKDTLKPGSNHFWSYLGFDLSEGPASSPRFQCIPWGKLEMCSMKLRLMPVSFAGIACIQNLTLSENPDLRVLPSLTHLVNLEYFSAYNCGLILPPKLDGLTKLRRIFLQRNNFKTPPNVAGFNELWILKLDKCVLEGTARDLLFQSLRDIRDDQKARGVTPEKRIELYSATPASENPKPWENSFGAWTHVYF